MLSLFARAGRSERNFVYVGGIRMLSLDLNGDRAEHLFHNKIFGSASALTFILLSLGPAALAVSGDREQLKTKFVQQMNGQNASLNLGLAYWIELNRQGHLYRTSNFASFQSGDQIRFHILPNADAYAYIVLRQGSQGTKCVLFPPAGGASNLVKRGSDCVVPQQGSLEFDQVPGTERVGLLLSRNQINPDTYLSIKAAAETPRVEPTSSEVSEKSGLERSDLEKSYDAIFGGSASGGAAKSVSTNPGALESIPSASTSEDAAKVLASPSTAVVVNDDPDSVVSVDFLLKHN